MTNFPIKDFPKIECPFKRKMVGERYVITPEIDEDYGWVFEDRETRAADKIDGTNVCILIKDGNIVQVSNRKNLKNIFTVKNQTKWEGACLEGLAKAIQKDWLKDFEDGYHYGELVGEIINGNPHKMQGHLWVPLNYLRDHCRWHSWESNKYPKTFEAINEWFKDIPSLFNQKMKLPEILAEGLVFYHSDGRMAKIRRDMFDWHDGIKRKE
ncbi:MAG: RNA ligase family protein [bacterium]